MKYILVTGGVMSGIGKGIITSSLGAILKSCRLNVTAIKIDPYINVDAGTFSPFEHGEVFVLNDGCEVDLDLGNYERFLDTNLCDKNNITTGKIYSQVIQRERMGQFLGKTVQVVPHITDAIQAWIEEAASIDPKTEICLIELGGTIGDIEGMPFIEALRQMRKRVKKENFCCCHVSWVHSLGADKEPKTKSTQQSFKNLGMMGIPSDIIICRSEMPIPDAAKQKISFFCDLEFEQVLNLVNLDAIYRAPIELFKQDITKILSDSLKINISTCECRLERWQAICDTAIGSQEEIRIALVGKYTALKDSYTSVVKSLEHASYFLGTKPKIVFIESEKLEEPDNQAWDDLKSCQCLIVPGGFGYRGVEGKIKAIEWARKSRMPFLGVCLGFQMAVIEYARNVCDIKNAHSAEFAQDYILEHGSEISPIVIEMLEYTDPEKKMGGTMRLGLRTTKFTTDKSLLRRKYGKDSIEERHRHRYEINPEYIELLEEAGLKFVGRNEDGTRMEIVELDESVHPYFVAVQFHPEYLSRPFNPSSPYRGLIETAKTLI